MTALDVILEAGRRLHMVEIEYERPGSAGPVLRLVEPYRLQHHNGEQMLLAWQVVPQLDDRLRWRNFRLDRILLARDTGHSFAPRAPVLLDAERSTPLSFSFKPDPAQEPLRNYRRQIEKIVLDARRDDQQLLHARSLQDGIEIDAIRAEHARVYARLIDELLDDERISVEDASLLASARATLGELGYAP